MCLIASLQGSGKGVRKHPSDKHRCHSGTRVKHCKMAEVVSAAAFGAVALSEGRAIPHPPAPGTNATGPHPPNGGGGRL